MIPATNDRFPLVVYLPGLGETAESGLVWRKAWAEAGYAVLSVQPASEGVAVWKSEQARLGDFQAVARTHFAASSLARRAQLLEGVFADLARHANGASAFARVDTQAIAVTGFDLGAQTAMIFAGERVDGVAALHSPAAIKAVIALSPYADFAGMGIMPDFEDIRIPVLGVTSGEDTDAYGLVTSPSVRRAPFRYMPAGDKYLLMLAGAPHSLMSGREVPETSTTEAARGSDGGTGSGEQRSRGGMRGRRGGGQRGGSNETPSAAGSPSINWKMELTDVKSVSVAFLDATVKDDPVAREWLHKDAQRWLGELAQLSSK
jgi:predicted dienelactone hydrolase